MAILKGRIIGLGLFAVYTGAGWLGPVPTVMGMALVAAREETADLFDFDIAF